MLQLRNEVLYKILESILQFRVQVKQQQFAKFNSLVKQISINHKNSFDKNTSKMLSSIILQEKFNIRQLIQQKKNHLKQKIYRQSGESFQTQIWYIQTSLKSNQEDPQNFDMLLKVFQELIFFLNRRPMFDLYQKNKELRKKYQVYHNILIRQNFKKSLIKLPKVQKQIRLSKNLQIRIDCYYTLNLDESSCFQKLQFEEKPRKQSFNIQSNENSTKVSVYSFYDPILNFTFISSDSEDFKAKENLQHHQIQNQNSDDEFQLLIMSQDQKFIDQNQKTFALLQQIESDYLNPDIYMR